MRRSLTPAVLGLFASVATALGAEPMKGGTRYRMTINVDSTFPGRKGPGTSWGMVAYDYRLARNGARVEMAIDRITRENSSNGQGINRRESTRTAEVSRAWDGDVRVTDRTNGRPEEIAGLDQMEAPFVVLTRDAEGREVGRELKGGIFSDTYVETLRPFPATFPKDKGEWDAKPPHPPMPGQESHGTLHYVKRPATKPGGPIEVEVSGKLKLTGKWGPGEIKEGHEEVKGVQTFDPSLGDWVASKLTIVTEIEMVTPAGETQTMRSTSVRTLTCEDSATGAAEKVKESP